MIRVSKSFSLLCFSKDEHFFMIIYEKLKILTESLKAFFAVIYICIYLLLAVLKEKGAFAIIVYLFA